MWSPSNKQTSRIGSSQLQGEIGDKTIKPRLSLSVGKLEEIPQMKDDL